MKRILTAEQLRAEIPRVTTFCANTIRKAVDPEVLEGIKTRSQLRPLNANELYQAAVNLTVKLVDVQQAKANGDENADALMSGEEIAAAMALIAIAKATTERGRAHIIAHELATQIQKTQVAQDLFSVETVECPGQNGRKVRHQIARKVEEMVCGTEPWDQSQDSGELEQAWDATKER